MTTETIGLVRESMLRDWEVFANLFIPLYNNNILYKIKQDIGKTVPECPYPTAGKFHQPLSDDKLLQISRDYMMIRNCLYSSGLQRPFGECKPVEIVNDKLGRLIKLINSYPRLEIVVAIELIKQYKSGKIN